MCTGSHNYTEFAYHLLPVALGIHCIATMSPATSNPSYKLYTDIPAERKNMHLKARCSFENESTEVQNPRRMCGLTSDGILTIW